MQREFKYKAVRKALEEDILSKMQIGDYLPPLKELCSLFNVSTITINRVLRDMGAEGRLERIKHCGTRLCDTIQPPVNTTKQQLKVLGTHPRQWLFMQIMEKKLFDFCCCHHNLELRCEYAARSEQIERMLSNDYDLIFADSSQIKLMLHSKLLRSKLQMLDDLPGLLIDPAEYVPAAVQLGCDAKKNLYGLPLTCGPNLQLIAKSENLPDMPELSNFYDVWFPQLLKLQHNSQPLLQLPLDYRYLEGIFRSYDAPLVSSDMLSVNLDSRPVKDILKMLEYYLHRQQLGLLISRQPGVVDNIQDNLLKSTPIPLHISSMIHLKPGCGCQNFRIKNLPQARHQTAWLFWEGVTVGRKCDPALAASVLNYLQSASVQSMLPGCTALPARLDMQSLALAAYEPEFPGLTAAYQTGLQTAANLYPLPYGVLSELNRYLNTVICGAEPIGYSSKNVARRINNMLNTSEFLKQ